MFQPGWRWCRGVYGQCNQCRVFTTGLWLWFKTETTSTMSVCAECAEEA